MPAWLPRWCWRFLPRWWWGLEGRFDGWRHRRLQRKLAADDPVRTLLTELAIEADARGVESLTARQRLVLRAWDAVGVISNGGFRFYLESALPLLPIADAFRTLGFEAGADACERVAAAVAAAPGLGEAARRTAVLEELGSEAFRDEDRAIFAIDWDELQDALGDYMRAHPRDFPGIAD